MTFRCKRRTESGTFQHGDFAFCNSSPTAEGPTTSAHEPLEEFGPMQAALMRLSQNQHQFQHQQQQQRQHQHHRPAHVGIPSGAHQLGAKGAASTAQTDEELSRLQLCELQNLGVLGQGSSGVVRKMRHLPTGRLICLKVIQFDVRSDQLRKQISRELHTLHGSRHPHIVAYYQSFLQDGAITIAMEYMNRDTLAHLLKRQAALQERHLACIARQVLEGLEYLHRALRVVHRDLKPSNLLLDSAGTMKISDFGVSGQLENSVSQCISWVGTVTYMSPERIRGDKYSFDSDIWSLGLTLVECAIGRFPYPPQVPGRAALPLGFWDLLSYIVDEPPPALPPQRFSPELCDFVRLCLQKLPAARPSAAELLRHPFLSAHPPGSASLAELLSPTAATETSQGVNKPVAVQAAAYSTSSEAMTAVGLQPARRSVVMLPSKVVLPPRATVPRRVELPFSGANSLI